MDTLRDSFPPSDKSLSRLLGEVPYLPDSVLKFLECMCSPGNCDKTEKETQGGDRVTQGLSIVWSLILLRPPLRDPCLKIALQVLSFIPTYVTPISEIPLYRSVLKNFSFFFISSDFVLFFLWKSAVHHLEEVRMKAIRLVLIRNLLLAQQINRMVLTLFAWVALSNRLQTSFILCHLLPNG